MPHLSASLDSCVVPDLKVLFRGVRELKKMQLLAIKHPKIIVECAGKALPGSKQTVESVIINDPELNSNFEKSVTYLDIVSTRSR